MPNNLKLIKKSLKKYFILSLFLLATYSAIGQTDTEKQNLKGSVLSVTQSIYFAEDSLGNLVKEKVISKAKYTFNTRGFIIESIFDNPDKYQYHLPEKSITTYKYDADFKIIETITEEGQESMRKKYFYTNLGNCIKTKTYNQRTGFLIDKSEFKYNSKNQLIAENNTHYADIINRILNYDANNNISEEIWNVKIKGEIESSSYTYKYNKNNLEIESVYKNEEQEISIVTTEYDSANNPILKTNDGTICKYKYTFDAQNNWTQCIQTIDSIKYMITEREITYHLKE
jgi:hypothetical protein